MFAGDTNLEAARRAARRAWQTYVIPALGSNEPARLLAALVVVDAALDAILVAEGVTASTAGGRFQLARRSFSDYSALCVARRLRHQAVHHLGTRLRWHICAPALAAYARALLEHSVDLRDAEESVRASGARIISLAGYRSRRRRPALWSSAV